MKPYKRPEKETDPDKMPGQVVNKPSHMEQPLIKAIEQYQKPCEFCDNLKWCDGRCERKDK